MIDVFEDGLSIDVGCPGDIPLNTTTLIRGTVSYRLVNAGDEDGIVSILATMIDSAGHNMQDTFNFKVVPAQGSFTHQHDFPFLASYDTPGQINVSIQVQFSGALNDTKFAECSFFVLD